MPGTSVDVGLVREQGRHGLVALLALPERGSLVDGGPHQRVLEGDRTLVDRDQPRHLGLLEPLAGQTERGCRSDDEAHLVGVGDGGEQQETLRLRGQSRSS